MASPAGRCPSTTSCNRSRPTMHCRAPWLAPGRANHCGTSRAGGKPRGRMMAELPRGTVTFLFTDIEGSTRLWERDRSAMASAVDRHLALLDHAIVSRNGVHFKTVGDAVQAAFPTAPDAVAAALAAQTALLNEEWGTSDPFRVRMALHAGEAIPDDRGDYLAAPLNRLARLLAIGHGGQVLLSQAVQQLT